MRIRLIQFGFWTTDFTERFARRAAIYRQLVKFGPAPHPPLYGNPN